MQTKKDNESSLSFFIIFYVLFFVFVAAITKENTEEIGRCFHGRSTGTGCAFIVITVKFTPTVTVTKAACFTAEITSAAAIFSMVSFSSFRACGDSG